MVQTLLNVQLDCDLKRSLHILQHVAAFKVWLPFDGRKHYCTLFLALDSPVRRELSAWERTSTHSTNILRYLQETLKEIYALLSMAKSIF